MYFTRHSLYNHLLRSSGVILFLVLWEVAPRLEWIDPYFVPPFSGVLSDIAVLTRNGALPTHLLVSAWRGLTGLLLALIVALPLGVVLGRWLTGIADAIGPILRILSQVNPFTLLPAFILFFGIGETAKVAIVAWVTLWPILFYTITATRTVDPVQIKSAAAMGISREDLLLKVILPASLPTIFVGIRIGASLTFYILVAAEMLGAGSGLGWTVHNSAMNYLIPRIYAGATFIVILGYLLNRFLLYIERSLLVWHELPTLFAAEDTRLFPLWRPGKRTAVAVTLTFLTILVFGGVEVRKLNREAAQSATGSGDHSKHFGSPVDSGGASY